MMTEILIIAIVTLVLGLAIGWLLGGRAAGRVREQLAAAQVHAGQVEQVRQMHQQVETERDQYLLELTESKARAAERETAQNMRFSEHELAWQSSHDRLLADKDALNAQFAETAARTLAAAQTQFLERADARFKQSGDDNESKLKALLSPVESTLKRYEEGLGRIEKEREGSYRELTHAVAQLTQGNVGVVRETQRLANVMKSSPKARGRWGEEQTQTILESAGLRENIDFTKQTSVADGEQQLRPDFIVNLPGNRCIVIDVKCPLVAFEQAFDEEDEARRADLLGQHAKAMGTYASDLARKGYWRQFDQSPEFVIMFVPGEHHLSAAAERAPALIENAFKNGVVIASTINLLALAKIMAGMWRQEVLHEQSKEIAEVGRELFKGLGVLSEHVAKLGKNLGTAATAYNEMIGSLEGNVYRGAQKLQALGIESGGKSVVTAPTMDAAIRPLIKLSGRPDLESKLLS